LFSTPTIVFELSISFVMAATATQRAKCTIHVSSLPSETNKDLLLAAFIPFGEIVDIQIPLNEDGTPLALVLEGSN
jgi:RNA recognition motif-containing protein